MAAPPARFRRERGGFAPSAPGIRAAPRHAPRPWTGTGDKRVGESVRMIARDDNRRLPGRPERERGENIAHLDGFLLAGTAL